MCDERCWLYLDDDKDTEKKTLWCVDEFIVL